jgi:hypothetical protein
MLSYEYYTVSLTGVLGGLLNSSLQVLVTSSGDKDKGSLRLNANLDIKNNLDIKYNIKPEHELVFPAGTPVYQAIRVFMLTWLDHELRECMRIKDIPHMFHPHGDGIFCSTPDNSFSYPITRLKEVDCRPFVDQLKLL